MKKTLSDYPELLKEWHPTLNGELNPHEISKCSHKKIWWKCQKKGHSWQAVPNSRTRNDSNKCPYCANKKVCEDNCLATTHPEMSKQWHPTLNSVTPNDVFAGTHEKYWWICSNNHCWQAKPNDRTRRNNDCPYCTNKKVCKDNCLATTHPELVKEWHPSKNEISPEEITSGSNRKVWWLCSKNHEWQANCKNRSVLKRGCPICSESRGEKEIARVLDELNIKYIREHTFEGCKHINKLRFDFAVCIGDNFKIIEYHGEQHYDPCNFGSKKVCKHDNLKKVRKRDKIKKKFCKIEGMPFLEISYKEYDKIGEKVKKFLLV